MEADTYLRIQPATNAASADTSPKLGLYCGVNVVYMYLQEF